MTDASLLLLHLSDRCHDGATLLRHYLLHNEFRCPTATAKRRIEGIARHRRDRDIAGIFAKQRLQNSFTSVMPIASIAQRDSTV